MRTEQMLTSSSTGWCNLLAAYPRVQMICATGGGRFAVPLVPGRARRFRPHPASRRYRRR